MWLNKNQINKFNSMDFIFLPKVNKMAKLNPAYSYPNLLNLAGGSELAMQVF